MNRSRERECKIWKSGHYEIKKKFTIPWPGTQFKELWIPGKDERSHDTWKEKIKYDVISNDEELNWGENLPIYQQLYNQFPHGCLGMQSPFEVYYGSQPNSVRNKLSLSERQAFEVSEKDKTEFQLKPPRKDILRQWEKEITTEMKLLKHRRTPCKKLK